MSEKSSQSNIPHEEIIRNQTCESFLLKFSEEMDKYNQARALHSFFLSYLLHYEQQTDFEPHSDALMEILSKIPTLCKMFLSTTCKSSYWNESEKVEDKTQNLECACLCFDIIHKSLETFTWMRQSISITKIALNILYLGYSHCKDSEIIYGDQLEQFVNLLGSFFKKIECLQMIVLQKLDQLNTVKDSEYESNIISVMQEVGNLCQVVSNIDADVAFDLWTLYIKLVSNHSYVMQNLSTNTLVACLALKILEILQQTKLSLDKDTEEDEDLSTQFTFYLNTLSNLLNVAEFNHKENILQLKTLLVNISDFLAACFSFVIEKSSLITIRNSLIKTTYPLILKLYSNEEFFMSVLNLNDSDQIVNSEAEKSQTGLVLLNLCALQFMECASMQQKIQIFQNILSYLMTSAAQTDTSLLYKKLPRCAVTKTNSDEIITLYQFAYEQISMLLKSMPDSVIQTLNNTELVWLTGTSDVVFLLISDVWTYRLRCSRIEFFKNQCHFIFKTCLTDDTYKKPKIMTFLKRLLKFLPKPEKEMLCKEFSTLKFFLDENEAIHHRYGTPSLSSSEYEVQSSAENIVRKMSELSEGHTEDVSQSIQRTCSCLELCTLFVNVAESSEILQFIEFANQMFKSDVYEVQIAVLTLIKALSRKYVPEHTSEFGKILLCMVQLFSQALHSKNFIVQNEALHTFSYFAKTTSHIRIVQETVKQDPSLKPLIKSYITAVPDNGFLTEKGKNECIQKLISMHKETEFKISESSKLYLQKVFSR